MGGKKTIKTKTKLNKNNLDSSAIEEKNPWQILFFAFILIFILYLFNVFFGSQNNNNQNITIEKAQQEKSEKAVAASNLRRAVNKEEMKADYGMVISDIKKSFLLIEDKDSNTDLAKFSYNSLGEMFKAVVPLENKEFHLKLTLSLNTINKLSSLGEENNDELKEEVDRLNGILGEWQ